MTGPIRERPPLRRNQLERDPVRQFRRWFRDAEREGALRYPNSVCLSTVDESGHPDGRIVLLKEFDERGFVFYTNLRSKKASDLEATPEASLTFYWESQGRQVRVRGAASRIEEEAADQYFRTRPRGSRIAAVISRQSALLKDREKMSRRFREEERRFGKGEIPRPAHWSGYRLRPVAMEFWQEGKHRLHDRFLYSLTGGEWRIERLYP